MDGVPRAPVHHNGQIERMAGAYGTAAIRFTQKAPTNGVVRGAFFETFVHFRDSAK